jgi:hypothetical protein
MIQARLEIEHHGGLTVVHFAERYLPYDALGFVSDDKGLAEPFAEWPIGFYIAHHDEGGKPILLTVPRTLLARSTLAPRSLRCHELR